MKDLFVSYELAKRFKKVFFRDKCCGLFHTHDHLDEDERLYVVESAYWILGEHEILAPTISQAINWLEKEHNIIAFVQPIYINHAIGSCELSGWFNNNDTETNEIIEYKTRREAELKAIENALKILETRIH